MSNGGKLSPDMLAAIICEKMHWTWQEYEDQPDFFISMLIIKWSVEAEYAKIKDEEKKL